MGSGQSESELFLRILPSVRKNLSSSAIGVMVSHPLLLTSAKEWEGRVSTMEGLRRDSSVAEDVGERSGEHSGEGLAVGELEGECVCSTHASVEGERC